MSDNPPDGKKGYHFSRDDIILALVLIWAICMIVFRY